MARVRVGSMSELQPGRMIEYRSGELQLAICNAEGSLHALNNECPHRGGPLSQGALHGRMVVCPWHAWEFDCTTGECDFNPEIRVARYAVAVENGEVFVEI